MLEDAILEAVVNTIRGTDYEGWVCYIDGVPIFEHVPHNPNLAQAAFVGGVQAVNRMDRNTRDWKELDQTKIHRVELYFAREYFQEQPVLRMDRMPGNHGVRYIQMKLGTVLVDAGAVDVDSPDQLVEGKGQRRVLAGYRMGFWNPAASECRLMEITRTRKRDLGSRIHPCWPEPFGYGIAPWAVGLQESEVPAPPIFAH